MTHGVTPESIIDSIGADKLISSVGTMGLHPVHSSEPFQVGLTQEELNGFWRRVGDQLRKLDSKLINRSNVCHIIGEGQDINMDGYDYICRRIKSGEANGSELKDLRLVKEIAEVIMDYRSCENALTEGDIRSVNRIMAKYPMAGTETRRSKARKNAVERVLSCPPNPRLSSMRGLTSTI